MERLGVRIKELRKSKGLTQTELSDEINNRYGTSINKSMISKWENGKEEPRLEYIRCMSKYFNTPADYLLGLDKDDNEVFSSKEIEEIEDFKKYVLSKRK